VCWPRRPDRVAHHDGDAYLSYDLDGDGQVDYVQRLRGGYKDRLFFGPPTTGRRSPLLTSRPTTRPRTGPLVLVLLDGVAYERMAALYTRGHFRLFRRPARLISVFPTLTDPAYDVLFGSGPTPGYEAGYFDRARNRLTHGLSVYLSGMNERWVRGADCRLNFVEDGIMYLFPSGVFSSELRRARGVLADRLRRGRRQAVIYLLSTDALGHMMTAGEIERHLLRIDGWLEQLVHAERGQLEIVMLSDHGIGAYPPERGYLRGFDLTHVMAGAGLRVRGRLVRPGDVVIPLFGLLDVARVHAYDEATRERVVEAVRGREEVELVASRVGQTVRLHGPGGDATIDRWVASGEGWYRYRRETADPLRLLVPGAGSDADREAGVRVATAAGWLAATHRDAFPAAVPRLWDGMFRLSQERPDVVLSLAEAWFVGSGLFSGLVRMRGTHGGLHRRVSETFAMATDRALPSPIDLQGLSRLLREQYGWEPGAVTAGAAGQKSVRTRSAAKRGSG
jgi:hypothetical protein